MHEELLDRCIGGFVESLHRLAGSEWPRCAPHPFDVTVAIKPLSIRTIVDLHVAFSPWPESFVIFYPVRVVQTCLTSVGPLPGDTPVQAIYDSDNLENVKIGEVIAPFNDYYLVWDEVSCKIFDTNPGLPPTVKARAVSQVLTTLTIAGDPRAIPCAMQWFELSTSTLVKMDCSD